MMITKTMMVTNMITLNDQTDNIIDSGPNDYCDLDDGAASAAADDDEGGDGAGGSVQPPCVPLPVTAAVRDRLGLVGLCLIQML